MKVSIVGNALNLGVLLGLFLRRLGHQPTLFLTQSGGAQHDDPEWEGVDPDELRGLPIERYDLDLKRYLRGGREERRFRNVVAEADVVQSFGEDVIWGAGTGTPDTVLSIGDDLDILPFRRDSARIRLYAALLRRAQRKCSALCYTMPPQAKSAARLGLENARFLPFAIPVDTERWRPAEPTERARIRMELGFAPDDFVVFQPSRQEWTCAEGPGSNHKGNDKLLRAWSRFAAGGRSTRLVCVEKGRDVARSKELLSELGTSDRATWIPAQNKTNLRRWLQAADVVADQFTYGFYGMSALDALATGRPVLVHLDEAARKTLEGGAPPVMAVQSEDEILEAVQALASSPELLEELGARSRNWTVEHHRWDVVVKRFTEVYRDIA